MEVPDATKVLLNRIQKLEPPETARKIIGCILIQDNEWELVRWACASDKDLENLVCKTKLQLEYLTKTAPISPPIPVNPAPASLNYIPLTPNGSRTYSYPPTLSVQTPHYWDPQLTSEQHSFLGSDYALLGNRDSVLDDYRLVNQARFVGLGYEDQSDTINTGLGNFPGDSYYPDSTLRNLSVRSSRRSLSLPEFPIKTCHYFNKGYCKHGTSCRYVHGSDSFSPLFGPNELGGAEDQLISPGSLEKLEVEIAELLKSRRGNSVSIASLPMMYYEKYGKTIQAEGYLTESQRHGRAGYSLTKLLARLKTIRLIDQAHGQHSVILAEDASKHNVENRNERNDPGPIVSGSRQIYMTFPAESTFTEEDVANHFSTFGPVEDVRMPSQAKRMFGFVSFASANTVRIVLAKGNPHFVCGSRVLVKPYRERPKTAERKFMEKYDHGMYYPGNYLDLEPDFQLLPRCDPPRVLRRQREEQEAQAMEMERRLSQLHLEHDRAQNQEYIDYATEERHASQDPSRFSAEQFNYLLFMNNSISRNADRAQHPGSDFADHEESQGINLPESPFASAVENGISAII